MSRALALFILCLALPALAACGKKPGTLEPPPGSEEADFPRSYPLPNPQPPQ